MDISIDTTIEELLEYLPESEPYLTDLGIRCIKCGAPVWDTLQESAERVQITEDQLSQIISHLKKMDDAHGAGQQT